MKIPIRRKVALRPEATQALKISLGIFQKKFISLHESVLVIGNHQRLIMLILDEFSARVRLLKTFNDGEQLDLMDSLMQDLSQALKELPALVARLSPIITHLTVSKDDLITSLDDLKLLVQEPHER